MNNICPNCGGAIAGHPENGCALAVLIGVIRDRGTMSSLALNALHGSVDSDAFWDALGTVVDSLENGEFDRDAVGTHYD